MICTYNLFTSEVDVIPSAVDDIQKQLAAVSLRKNTVGILVCHYDYVEYGVVSALKDILPFPLIGITTFYQATPQTSGLFDLTVTILTSDDVEFSLAYDVTGVNTLAPRERIEQIYQTASAGHDAPPAFIISFLSANRSISGDEYLRFLDQASGGVPSFGVVNSGEEDSGANIYIISDKEAFSDGSALLLLYGDVQARTYINEPPVERLLELSATVTATDGVVVKEINSQPAMTYLKKNGVDLDDISESVITAVPFYYRLPEEEKLTGRIIKNILPDGSIEFMAEIPEGAILRVGVITADDILEGSYNILKKAVAENPEASAFLIASCVGRFITLGLETTAEMDHTLAVIPEGKNYLASYVGGEICPVDVNGQLVNRYHNNTFIVLALQ